jgi:GAF domain-containing protein
MSLPAWLAPPTFEADDQRRLARNLYTILVAIFAFELLFGLLAPFVFRDILGRVYLFQGITLAFTLVCYLLMHRGQLKLASLLFTSLFGLSTLAAIVQSNGLDSLNIQIFILVILFAGLLLGARYSLLFAVLGVASLVGLHLAQTNNLITVTQIVLPVLLKLALPSFVFLVGGILLATVTQNTAHAMRQAKQHETALEKANADLKNAQTTLEQRVEERTAQLQASVDISQTISQLFDTDELGTKIAEKLATLFGYNFAALYFLDQAEREIILRYCNQDAALPRRQAYDLHKPNALANAIRSQKPVLTVTPPQPAQFSPTAFTLDIQTEIALPLLARGKPIGVLNLQSIQPLTLTPREIATLQSIANQIAAAFENIRLFNETQQQLHEINRLNQFYLHTTWRALLTQEIPAYRYALGTVTEVDTPNETALEIAQQAGKVHIKNENGFSTLIAPIMFQNQVLGALELTAQNRHWGPDEILMIEAVVNQTALSLENTRLMLETRSRAEQEKMVSEISGRIRETLDLETILQTSVLEMQKSLKLSEVEIRLLPPPIQDTSELRMPASASSGE